MAWLQAIVGRARPRFSLRTLLIVTAAVAAFGWWREQPRKTAERFVAAIEAGRYGEADELLTDADDPLTSIKPITLAAFIRADNRNRITASFQRQSPGEWLRGECLVSVQLDDFRGLGASIQAEAVATAQDLLPLRMREIVHGAQLLPELSGPASQVR